MKAKFGASSGDGERYGGAVVKPLPASGSRAYGCTRVRVRAREHMHEREKERADAQGRAAHHGGRAQKLSGAVGVAGASEKTCVRARERVCRFKNVPVLALSGGKYHDGDASAHGGETPASSVRSRELKGTR
jgi:hypothetical protein